MQYGVKGHSEASVDVHNNESKVYLVQDDQVEVEHPKNILFLLLLLL